MNPFLTGYNDHPDYNEADHQAEFERMCQRNDAIQDLLDGNQSPGYVLDLLESQDIDPLVYVESTWEAVKYCIEHPELDIEIVYEDEAA